MAILGGRDKTRNAQGNGKIQKTSEEFKDWLMTFDYDKDRRISQKELRSAIKSCGAWFSSRKSGRGMDQADVDGSGYIDEDEISNLVDFAEKVLGFKIVD